MLAAEAYPLRHDLTQQFSQILHPPRPKKVVTRCNKCCKRKDWLRLKPGEICAICDAKKRSEEERKEYVLERLTVKVVVRCDKCCKGKDWLKVKMGEVCAGCDLVFVGLLGKWAEYGRGRRNERVVDVWVRKEM
jgi:hypothetical protein